MTCEVEHCERDAALRLPTITGEVDLCAEHAPWIPVQRAGTGEPGRARLTVPIVPAARRPA